LAKVYNLGKSIVTSLGAQSIKSFDFASTPLAFGVLLGA